LVLAKAAVKQGVKATTKALSRVAGARALRSGAQASGAARDAIQNLGRKGQHVTGGRGLTGGPAAGGGAARRPDFIVNPKGVTIPTSKARLERGFREAGRPSEPADPGPGTIWHMRDGTRVRVMEPSGQHVRRAIWEKKNGDALNPFTGKQPQPPKPKPPDWRQIHHDQTHFPLGP
jgi:hypothetical protein